MAAADDEASPATLEAVDRRRTHLWIVTGVFLLVVSAAVALTLSSDARPLAAPAVRFAFIGLAVAFGLYVVEQERLLRRLTRALLEAEVSAAGLRAHVHDLMRLSRVGRSVSATLAVDDVVALVLDAAVEFTGASGASVRLEDGEATAVERTRGDLLEGDPRRSLTVPLVADAPLGTLRLDRAGTPFTAVERRSVELLADHAATAISNARRYEEQRAVAGRLEDALNRRGEFVATLVHELRSPLTAIVGFATVLDRRSDDLDPQTGRELIRSVSEQARRLSRMVDDVLAAASVDAGAELSRGPVDLVELLAERIGEAGGVALGRDGTERSIELVAPAGPVTVAADRQALSRVFGNLLENAVKYSPPGAPVTVTLREERGGWVGVEVADRGRGIGRDELRSIFDRFRRPGGGPAGGVGLGLHIVRSLVAAHGGRISVRSEPGEGSTFGVWLPVAAHDPRPDSADLPLLLSDSDLATSV